MNRNDFKGLLVLAYYAVLGPALFLAPYFLIRLLIHVLT